jgi:hypothetical protein
MGATMARRAGFAASPFVLLLALLTFSTLGVAEDQGIAVGQGVSSPTAAGHINFSFGYTPQNPVIASEQPGPSLDFTYADNGAGVSELGAELGFGGSGWGIAAGVTNADCGTCQTTLGVAAALKLSPIGLGLGFGKDLSVIGFQLSGANSLRWGLVGSQTKATDFTSELTALGAGVSYVGKWYVFALDVSQRRESAAATSENLALGTVGAAFGLDVLRLSFNYDFHVGRRDGGEDEGLWLGIGLSTARWRFAIYSDHVADLSSSFTLLF